MEMAFDRVVYNLLQIYRKLTTRVLSGVDWPCVAGYTFL